MANRRPVQGPKLPALHQDQNSGPAAQQSGSNRAAESSRSTTSATSATAATGPRSRTQKERTTAGQQKQAQGYLYQGSKLRIKKVDKDGIIYQDRNHPAYNKTGYSGPTMMLLRFIIIFNLINAADTASLFQNLPPIVVDEHAVQANPNSHTTVFHPIGKYATDVHYQYYRINAGVF